jgi:hypothetical protein
MSRDQDTGALRAAGFKAGQKWAEKPAEYAQLRRIVEKFGEDIEGSHRRGGCTAADGVAAACFERAADAATTARFWKTAANDERPGEAFVYGFYYGLKDVFDEVNSAQGR